MSAMASIMPSKRSDRDAVRTLVVDDSVVVRTVIERILNGDPGSHMDTTHAMRRLCSRGDGKGQSSRAGRWTTHRDLDTPDCSHATGPIVDACR